MRTFLFLGVATTGRNPEEDHLVQIGSRLVVADQWQDCHLLFPPATHQAIDTRQAFDTLSTQLARAELIVSHHAAFAIATIIAEARRAGRQEIVTMLSPPQFGFDGGTRAAICTQQLSADYFRYLGQPATSANTQLSTIYPQLFGEALPSTHNALAAAIACQRIYHFLNAFQQQQSVAFGADIVCLAD